MEDAEVEGSVASAPGDQQGDGLGDDGRRAEVLGMARQGGTSLGGAIFNQTLRFAITLVIARQLGPDVAGLYFQSFAILAFLSLVASAAATDTLTRYVAVHRADGDDAALRGTIRLGLTTTAAIAAIMAIALFALIMSLNGFVFGVISVQLVPLLEAAGLATAAAVWVASLKGVAQFGGRVVEIVFARNLRAITVGRIAIGVLPPALALLLAGTGSLPLVLAFTLLMGASQGMGPRNFTMNNFFKNPLLESPGAYAARDGQGAGTLRREASSKFADGSKAAQRVDRSATTITSRLSTTATPRRSKPRRSKRPRSKRRPSARRSPSSSGPARTRASCRPRSSPPIASAIRR
jgi:hypothetical protein